MVKRIILNGDPRTKKNSQRICVLPNGSRFIKPSAQYEAYEKACLWQLKGKRWGIDRPVNVRCVYYMATKRKVDLCNLLEATNDILVKAGVLEDDNSNVVASHDGSRVRYDKDNPRCEIEITDCGEKWVCETCVHYPPSGATGKPCCFCDPDDPLLNCHEEVET